MADGGLSLKKVALLLTLLLMENLAPFPSAEAVGLTGCGFGVWRMR